MYFYGGARDGAYAQDLQRGACSRLLALPDGAALAGADLAAVYRHGGGEVRAVRRALLGLDPVGRA